MLESFLLILFGIWLFAFAIAIVLVVLRIAMVVLFLPFYIVRALTRRL